MASTRNKKREVEAKENPLKRQKKGADELPLSAVPGPTLVSESTQQVYSGWYLSSDQEVAFFDEYLQTQLLLERLLGYQYTHSASEPDRTVIMSGEAMVALWAGLKSVIKPHATNVLALANGLYGEGIGEMARQCGADVEVLSAAWDAPLPVERCVQTIRQRKPHLVTMVHSDTPCGNLNQCLPEIGKACQDAGSLLYVDFVSSAFSVPLQVASSHIDIGLLGSQKVLGLLPDLAVLTVSARAWQTIDQVGYKGYDALAPWKHGVAENYFPYTHNWRSIRALQQRLAQLEESPDGLLGFYRRHEQAMDYVRKRLTDLGLQLLIADRALASRSCTTCKLPEGVSFSQLDSKLRQLPKPIYIGDNYAKLKGCTLRLGHMGQQQTDPAFLREPNEFALLSCRRADPTLTARLSPELFRVFYTISKFGPFRVRESHRMPAFGDLIPAFRWPGFSSPFAVAAVVDHGPVIESDDQHLAKAVELSLVTGTGESHCPSALKMETTSIQEVPPLTSSLYLFYLRSETLHCSSWLGELGRTVIAPSW
eukprot:g81534.t1